MPELPEVEGFRRYFEQHGLGRKVVSVRVNDERSVRGISAAAFKRRLKGRRFERTRRHGKHLFVATDGPDWLYLHFGMTGDLEAYPEGAENPRFAKVVWGFADGMALAFSDFRLFGFATVLRDPDAFISAKKLGPDPLDPAFDDDYFIRQSGARSGAIKAVLMSQEVVAGLGNLYVDEILYQAAIHPRTPAKTLTKAQLRSVAKRMHRVLRMALERQLADRDLPRDYLFDHREEGARCPRCGGEVARSVVFGRTTYFCSRHQQL